MDNYKYEEIDAGITDRDFIDSDDVHIMCLLLEYEIEEEIVNK